MTKKTRVLSVILAVMVMFSLLSAFSVTFAIDPQDAAIKAAADVNMFSNNPFKAIDNPGYGADIKATNIVFVDDNWAGVANDSWVYLDYDGLVYKAIKGSNAFGSIAEAVESKGRENLIIKIGAGTYGDGITQLAINGIKFYGNYAGTDPNVDGDNIYTKKLNPERDPNLETNFTGKITLKSDIYNITFDGFTITGAAQITVYTSSKHNGDIYFYNNIFTACTTDYVIQAGAGYTHSLYIKNNRFVNNAKVISQFGGQNDDVQIENNYYENCTNSAFYINATGNTTGGEALISFTDNVAYNCKNVVRFDYNNANYGSNLNFNRVTGNIFYGCSGDYVIYEKMYPEYVKDGNTVKLLDPKSKTFITNNQFLAAPATTPIIKLDGQESLSGADAQFIVSAIENKFVFSTPSADTNRAVRANVKGIIDASYCYTNADSITDIFEQDINLGTIVTMPYYIDEEMTQLVSVGDITWQKRSMDKYFETAADSYGIDEKQSLLFATAKAGIDTIILDQNSLVAAGSTYQIYYDFSLARPAAGNTVHLSGDRTTLYLVVTDQLTGQSSKFGLVIKGKPDKSKAEFRYLFDGETDADYTQYRTEDDNSVVYVSLDNETMFFPFYVVASPAATVEYYTDAELKTKYTDSTYYMKPDDKTIIYTKITSGDGKKTNVVRLEFKRTGSDIIDAQILRVKTPVENIIVFNNERKSIVYRPFAMVDEVVFDFEISTGATYKLYSDVSCTNLVSSMEDVKTLPVGDAITYYYLRVINPYGYEQTYTIIIYNDVKSTDNVITGITGYTLGEGLTIDENNVITIEASSTLALVNAHFETNAFAKIEVYPDEQKTFSMKPSITIAVVNNREVEVPTFQLGITGTISYFWVDVTSEVGETNSYRIIIKKPTTTDAKFSDVKGHWAEKYINDVASLGIVNGIGNGMYAPNAFATRQQMAVVLCKMLGIESHAFRGVNLGEALTDANSIAEWSYDYVKAAYQLKFMVGSNGKFNPDANITRQEFFVAIASVLKLDIEGAKNYDLSSFKDLSNVASWALPYTKACVKAGIVSGSNGMLNPKANISRAEIATIVSQVTTVRDDIWFA